MEDKCVLRCAPRCQPRVCCVLVGGHPQAVGIVMLAAAGIVVAASFVTQRRPVNWVLLGCGVSIALAILLLTTFALRLANSFRLTWVRGKPALLVHPTRPWCQSPGAFPYPCAPPLSPLPSPPPPLHPTESARDLGCGCRGAVRHPIAAQRAQRNVQYGRVWNPGACARPTQRLSLPT